MSTMQRVSSLVSADIGNYLTNKQTWGGILYNVKAYGAKGDGETDDTAAIQRAADDIPNGQLFGGDPGKSGGKLFFPQGNYIISSSIMIDAPGVFVEGLGTETTVITLSDNFTGEAALVFRQSNTGYSDVAIGMRDIEIDTNNKAAHGIIAYKAYDNVTFHDLNVVNIADAYNGYRFIPDPLITDTISQTLLFMNCMGIHKNKTATAPLYYLEDCQETNLIGCKAFGTYESNLTPPGYNDVPMLNAYHFVDCRGITMMGCSIAFVGDHAIKVEAKDRSCNGFLFIGTTFESCINGVLDSVGTASFSVENVSLRQSRIEGTNGTIALNYTNLSLIESNGLNVTISSTCQRNHIFTEDYTKITDNGQYTTIYGYGNAINSSIVLYPAIDVLAKVSPSIEFGINSSANRWLLQYDFDGTTDNGFRVKNNNVDVMKLGSDLKLYSAGAESITASYPFGANQVGMLVAVNNGSITMKRVEIGAVDSGGTGFRMLRVTN